MSRNRISRLGQAVLCSLTLLVTSVPCHAGRAVSEQSIHPDKQQSAIKSSISLQGGVLDGMASEYVFSGGNRISQLDWGMRPVALAGLTLAAQFFNRFFLNLGYWTGINGSVGHMEDSDYTSFGILSRFSKQNSVLQKAHFIDINAGYTQGITDQLSLAGMVGFSFIDFALAARDGYIQYPPGSTPQPFFGIGIVDEQEYSIPYVGIGATYEVLDWFYVQIVPAFSPLAHCRETDSHFRRAVDVYSSMSLGQYASLSAVLGWKITGSTSLALSTEYSRVNMGKGESYNVDLVSGARSPTASNSASVRFAATTVMLSVDHALSWK